MSETKPSTTKTEIQRLAVWDTPEIEVTRTRAIKRLTFRNLMSEIGEAFNLNRGLIYTIKNLTIRPAQTIRSYLDTERDLVLSPFKYFIFIVGITLFIASLNGYFDMFNEDFFDNAFQAGYGEVITDDKVAKIQHELSSEMMDLFGNYYLKYQNFWYALTLIFTGWFSWQFFKKSGFNFIEHLAINTFTFAHTYLLYLIMVCFKLTDPIWSGIYMIIYIGYTVYVFKQLFGYSTGKTIFRGLMAYIVSLIIFMILIAIVMLIFMIKYMKDNPVN